MSGRTFQRVKLSREELRQILKNHDSDGDGRLSRKELKEAFQFLGALFPSIRARLALFCADSNGDGFVTETEFEVLLNYAYNRKYTVI